MAKKLKHEISRRRRRANYHESSLHLGDPQLKGYTLDLGVWNGRKQHIPKQIAMFRMKADIHASPSTSTLLNR